MKKNRKNYRNLLLTVTQFVVVSAFLLCTTSCNPDYNVDVEYAVVCSPNLLEFVTPVVTYTEGGETKTYEIKDSDWDKSGSYKSSVSNISVSTEVSPCYVWTKKITFNEFGVYSDITVTYKKKEGVEVKDGTIYSFRHDIWGVVSTSKEEHKLIGGEDEYDYKIDTPNTLYVNIGGGDSVIEYIDNLTKNPDKKEYYIDGNGDIKEQDVNHQ